MPQIVFSRLLHLLQDHGRDLGWGVPLAPDLDGGEPVGALYHLIGQPLGLLLDLTEAAPHQAFDREDGLLGVGDGLALGHLAYQALAILGKGDDRWGGPTPFGVGNDDRVPTLHNCHNRVGGPQVDADDFGRHVYSSNSGVAASARLSLAEIAALQVQAPYRIKLPFWHRIVRVER